MWLVSSLSALTILSRLLELVILELTRQDVVAWSAALDLNRSVSVNVGFLTHDNGRASLSLHRIRLLEEWALPARWRLVVHLLWQLLVLRRLSLLVQVLEFDVDHAQVLLGEAEGFSVGKPFDGCKLIEQDQIIVLNVEVNRVQVLLQNRRVDHVDSSLLQAHIHNAT